MWQMLQYGMVGPLQHYIPAYTNYAMQHNSIQAQSKSRKKPEPFDRVFKQQNMVLQGRDPSIQKQNVSDKFLEIFGPRGKNV